MNGFRAGPDWWRVRTVTPDSPALVDRTGSRCLGTADPSCLTVYIADSVKGDRLARVLVHEMVHAVLWSTGLLKELRSMAKPWRRVEAEEWACNLVADYGWALFVQARDIMGAQAVMHIPEWLRETVETNRTTLDRKG